jgi:hypothetical protein
LVPPLNVNKKNSGPFIEIVPVRVRLFPNNCFFSKTAGVPTYEYPYLLKGYVPIPISSITNMITFGSSK